MAVKVNPIKINHNLFDEVKVKVDINQIDNATITNIELVKTASIVKNEQTGENDIEITVVPVYSICSSDGKSFGTIMCLDWGEDKCLDIREHMFGRPTFGLHKFDTIIYKGE